MLSVSGILYSSVALYQNSQGGKHDAGLNMNICGAQARFFRDAGQPAEAAIAARDCLEFIAKVEGEWLSSVSTWEVNLLRPTMEQLADPNWRMRLEAAAVELRAAFNHAPPFEEIPFDSDTTDPYPPPGPRRP
jgi:hypothetical protein